MKFIALFAVITIVRAGVVLQAPVATTLVNTGVSTQHRSQDNLGNYNFGYDEKHATGGTFRRETGINGVKVGSYGLFDADGRQRIVNYVADANGFRADIKTNEPGVDDTIDPASTTINKDALVVAAAAPVAFPVLTAPVVKQIAAPSVVQISKPVHPHFNVIKTVSSPIITQHQVAVAKPTSTVTFSTYETPTVTRLAVPVVEAVAPAPVNIVSQEVPVILSEQNHLYPHAVYSHTKYETPIIRVPQPVANVAYTSYGAPAYTKSAHLAYNHYGAPAYAPYGYAHGGLIHSFG